MHMTKIGQKYQKLDGSECGQWQKWQKWQKLDGFERGKGQKCPFWHFQGPKN